MGRGQGAPIPSPVCWVRSLSFGPWVPHLFARSLDPVLSCPCPAASYLSFFFLGFACLLACTHSSHPPFPTSFSQSLSPSHSHTHTRPFRQARFSFSYPRRLVSLASSFGYTLSFILISFRLPEPEELTRAFNPVVVAFCSVQPRLLRTQSDPTLRSA